MGDKDVEDMVEKYLLNHPDFAYKWYAQNGPLAPRSSSSGSVDPVVSSLGSVAPTVHLLRTQLSANQRGTPSLAALVTQTGSEDSEHLAASYVQMTRGGRNSVTCQLFKEMLSSDVTSGRKNSRLANGQRSMSEMTIGNRDQLNERLRHLDEQELFMELIRDISNELDIDTLCHKILVNVSILTKSDRGSLFLAKGSRNDRYLVAKLFDVTPDSLLEQSIIAAEQYSKQPIPFGLGIAGHVALTKETIVIKDAYEDARFNKDIDARTGYRTVSIMCKPILNCQGDVIGVAQCINKTSGDHEFTKADERVFARYLTFCGIGIQNAQLFEMSIQEYKRNQLLLLLARSIFEETSSLDILINKIMTQAQGLLRSQRCRVYLRDTEQVNENNEASQNMIIEDGSLTEIQRKYSRPQVSIFHVVYELESDGIQINKLTPSDLKLEPPVDICLQMAVQVALTGHSSNWTSEASVPSDNDGWTERSILSVPIQSSSDAIIGVAQLVNKVDGDHCTVFTEVDVATLEAFAIFCGLGIHNTQIYEQALKLMAKQKVALEILSYHASSSIEETRALMTCDIPSAETFKLYKYDFCDFTLDDRETCLASLSMFLELQLIAKFHIPYNVLCRWVLSVKKNYRPVVYHNWRHSLNVTQTMFAMLTVGGMHELFSDLEQLALLVACLCHDLDHRGTNNSFQTKIASPLATLYGTSTMEHHHFDQCIMILNSEGNNILQSLSPDEYTSAIKIVKSAILSTDLAQYFTKRDKFVAIADAGETTWRESEKRDLLRGMLMTACDVSAIAKPWPVQKKIAELVAAEFFQQGDIEKSQLHQQPMPMMDRDKINDLPKMQVGFIDDICLPVYSILSKCWPGLVPLKDGCSENRRQWLQLAELQSER